MGVYLAHGVAGRLVEPIHGILHLELARHGGRCCRVGMCERLNVVRWSCSSTFGCTKHGRRVSKLDASEL